jgi:RNA polymerase sigma-70 factor (ECF subfamily)
MAPTPARPPGPIAEQEWDWQLLRTLALRQARRLLDVDRAEDAAQEAVLRAWRNARACTGADPAPWVATIARREALRIVARTADEPLAGSSDEVALGPDDLGPSAADERLDMRTAVRRLSRPEREALLLHYWADMTHEQIAATLQIPLGTVKLRVFRARMKLKPVVGAREE